MKLLLKSETLVDGTGSPAKQNYSVLTENGKITAISDSYSIESSTNIKTIDVPGGTILPGFIEMHSHIHCSSKSTAFEDLANDSDETLLIRATQAVRTALLSGVTTMRDLGSQNNIALSIRNAISNNIIPGPHLLIAGTPITTTGGHCHMFGTEADTLDQVITALRSQVKLGMDWIKIMAPGGRFTPRTNPLMPQYSLKILQTVVEEAGRLGIPVAAHCHATSGIKSSAESGINNLIHATWLSHDPDKVYQYEPRIADMIAEKGLYVDPTIATISLRQERDPNLSELSNNTNLLGDRDTFYENLRDMWDRGIKLVTGLDSGMNYVGFGDYAWVPTFMVEKLGLSPIQAIQSGTSTSANCLGISKTTGTLQLGKRADIVIVKGNASKSIQSLHNVDTVIKAGEIVKQSAIPKV